MKSILNSIRWPLPTHNGNEPPIQKLWWWQTCLQVIGVCGVMVVLIKLGSGLQGWSEVVASENGPVERISAAVWFMAFTWSFMAGWCDRVFRIEWLLISPIFLLFGLRELDAHVWATGWNLDKFANYWNPQFPLTEKIVVLTLMVLPCVGVGVLLCIRFWSAIGPAWRRGSLWLGHVIFVGILLAICLALDKIGAYTLPYLGIGTSGQVFFMMIEEFLEMVLAVFAFVSIWPYLQEAFNGID